MRVSLNLSSESSSSRLLIPAMLRFETIAAHVLAEAAHLASAGAVPRSQIVALILEIPPLAFVGAGDLYLGWYKLAAIPWALFAAALLLVLTISCSCRVETAFRLVKPLAWIVIIAFVACWGISVYLMATHCVAFGSKCEK